MLDYRIYTFLTLCEKMNYTKTAEVLHITQPAVTQHIRWLEDQYRCRLFSYQGKVLRLTEKGAMLQNFAQQMVSNEIGVHAAMEQQENAEIHLRIGATKTIGDYILPVLLTDFLKQNPKYRLHLVVDNTERLLQELEHGSLDLVMLEGFFDKRCYDYTLYKKERFLGICNKDSHWKNKKITLWDIRHEPLILREKGSGTRDIFEEVLKEQNITLLSFDTIQEISNFQTIKKMVENDLGITFLYEPVVHKELENGSLCALELEGLEIYRELNYVYMQNGLFREVYEPFLQFAKNWEQQYKKE